VVGEEEAGEEFLAEGVNNNHVLSVELVAAEKISASWLGGGRG